MRTIVFTVMLFFFIPCTRAQSGYGSVSGTITDGRTKKPVPFAAITVMYNATIVGTAIADINGKYMVKPLYPGQYRVIAEYILYHNTEKQAKVMADSTVVLNMELKQMDCHGHYTNPPSCPRGNHTNRIVPVVYGKPDAVTKSGKVYYGGEEVKCEEYYCKKHKKAF